MPDTTGVALACAYAHPISPSSTTSVARLQAQVLAALAADRSKGSVVAVCPPADPIAGVESRPVALNVLGHMSLALGASLGSDLLGKSHLSDASGILHAGIAKYPLIILQATRSEVRETVEKARQCSQLIFVDFPEQMLRTGHDRELRAALGVADEAKINYLGVLVYGDTAAINDLTRAFHLWK